MCYTTEQSLAYLIYVELLAGASNFLQSYLLTTSRFDVSKGGVVARQNNKYSTVVGIMYSSYLNDKTGVRYRGILHKTCFQRGILQRGVYLLAQQ